MTRVLQTVDYHLVGSGSRLQVAHEKLAVWSSTPLYQGESFLAITDGHIWKRFSFSPPFRSILGISMGERNVRMVVERYEDARILTSLFHVSMHDDLVHEENLDVGMVEPFWESMVAFGNDRVYMLSILRRKILVHRSHAEGEKDVWCDSPAPYPTGIFLADDGLVIADKDVHNSVIVDETENGLGFLARPLQPPASSLLIRSPYLVACSYKDGLLYYTQSPSHGWKTLNLDRVLYGTSRWEVYGIAEIGEQAFSLIKEDNTVRLIASCCDGKDARVVLAFPHAYAPTAIATYAGQVCMVSASSIKALREFVAPENDGFLSYHPTTDKVYNRIVHEPSRESNNTQTRTSNKNWEMPNTQSWHTDRYRSL